MNVRNTAFAAAFAGAATLGMSGGAGAMPLGSALPAPDTRAIAGAAAATEGGIIWQAGFRGRRHHRGQLPCDDRNQKADISRLGGAV